MAKKAVNKKDEEVIVEGREKLIEEVNNAKKETIEITQEEKEEKEPEVAEVIEEDPTVNVKTNDDGGVSIELSEIKKIEDKINDGINASIKEDIEPVIEIANEVKEMTKSEDKIKEAAVNNPEGAEAYLNSELKKAKQLQEKLQNVISKNNNAGFNNYWNGVNFDF